MAKTLQQIIIEAFAAGAAEAITSRVLNRRQRVPHVSTSTCENVGVDFCPATGDEHCRHWRTSPSDDRDHCCFCGMANPSEWWEGQD